MLYTAPGLSEYISGVILHQETLFQSDAKGNKMVDLITGNGMIPGLKVDKGYDKAGLPGTANGPLGHAETWCKGIDDLEKRCAEAYAQGARFAKWRNVLQIDPDSGLPSDLAIEMCVQNLAQVKSATENERRRFSLITPGDFPHAMCTHGRCMRLASFHALHSPPHFPPASFYCTPPVRRDLPAQQARPDRRAGDCAQRLAPDLGLPGGDREGSCRAGAYTKRRIYPTAHTPFFSPRSLLTHPPSLPACPPQFRALALHQVYLEGAVLKPNMVKNGLTGPKAPAEDVAIATVTALRRTVPAAMPGIFFLSGETALDEDNEETATINLNAMHAQKALSIPWHLSFSFGKALQKTCIVTCTRTAQQQNMTRHIAPLLPLSFAHISFNSLCFNRDGQRGEQLDRADRPPQPRQGEQRGDLREVRCRLVRVDWRRRQRQDGRRRLLNMERIINTTRGNL